MFTSSSLYQEDLDNILSCALPWKELQGKKLLITGASGLIGTVLIDALMKWNRNVKNGITIFAVGRNEQRIKERFSDYLDNLYFKFIRWDVNETADFNVQIDYVIHAASNTHPKAYAGDPIGSIMTNLLGLRNVLDFAHKIQSKRVLFLSSVEIYGKAYREDDVFTEEYCGYIDCNTLRAGYPEGKRAGEALCQAYIEKYDMDIVIPRLSRIYGPTMLLSDSKAMSQFIINCVHDEDIILKSEGKQRFSYTYAADAVEALFFLLLKGKNGEAYNVAQTDYPLTFCELTKLMAASVSRQVVFDLPSDIERKGFSKAMIAVMSSEKIEKLGWKMRNTMDKGLIKTISILKSMENL